VKRVSSVVWRARCFETAEGIGAVSGCVGSRRGQQRYVVCWRRGPRRWVSVGGPVGFRRDRWTRIVLINELLDSMRQTGWKRCCVGMVRRSFARRAVRRKRGFTIRGPAGRRQKRPWEGRSRSRYAGPLVELEQGNRARGRDETIGGVSVVWAAGFRPYTSGAASSASSTGQDEMVDSWRWIVSGRD